MHRLLISLVLLLLAGCGQMTPLTGRETIFGIPVRDTVLIVEEEFSLDGDVLPAGVYYPDMGSTDNWVLYVGQRPLTVKLLLSSIQCVGGVQVSASAPYEKYDLFYYGCGDPVTAIHIPKKLKFRIVPRPEIRPPKLAFMDGEA